MVSQCHLPEVGRRDGRWPACFLASQSAAGTSLPSIMQDPAKNFFLGEAEVGGRAPVGLGRTMDDSSVVTEWGDKGLQKKRGNGKKLSNFLCIQQHLVFSTVAYPPPH